MGNDGCEMNMDTMLAAFGIMGGEHIKKRIISNGASAVPKIIERMEKIDPGGPLRMRLIEEFSDMMVKIGRNSIPFLKSKLESDIPWLRGVVIDTILKIDKTEALEIFKTLQNGKFGGEFSNVLRRFQGPDATSELPKQFRMGPQEKMQKKGVLPGRITN